MVFLFTKNIENMSFAFAFAHFQKAKNLTETCSRYGGISEVLADDEKLLQVVNTYNQSDFIKKNSNWAWMLREDPDSARSILQTVRDVYDGKPYMNVPGLGKIA